MAGSDSSTSLSLGWFIAELRRRSTLLYWVGLAHLVLAAVLLVLMPFDDGVVLGIDRWVKPFKFAVSIWMYTWTFGWFVEYLKSSRLAKVLCYITAVTMLIEIVLITMQAQRGALSHFNIQDAFGIAVYSAMGTAIGIGTGCAAVLLIGLMFSAKELPPEYLLAVRLGLVLFLVGSSVGGALVANNGHAVGAEDGGAGLPLINWSTEGGDLRVAHALGLHALQAVPLFAFFLMRWTRLSRAKVKLSVWGFSAVYVSATVALYLQAMAGRSLI